MWDTIKSFFTVEVNHISLMVITHDANVMITRIKMADHGQQCTIMYEL